MTIPLSCLWWFRHYTNALFLNSAEESGTNLQRLFSAQDRGLLELPFDKILAKKEECGYCYPLLRRTRNISMFTVREKNPFFFFWVANKQNCKMFSLQIIFSRLKHLLSHTFYTWLILQAMEKITAFNVRIACLNWNYSPFLNRDTGILIYFFKAFTFLLLEQNFKDNVCWMIHNRHISSIYMTKTCKLLWEAQGYPRTMRSQEIFLVLPLSF